MTATPAARARSRRGWWALALGALIAGTAALADGILKRAPHSGFVLPGADLSMSASNLPAAWDAFEHSPAFDRIQAEAPQVYQRIGLFSRHRTGIRWTPLRWYVWFGRPLSVSQSSGEWVMSCRPGLLLRGADALGVLDHANWREGFLVIGTSAQVVDSILRDGVKVHASENFDAISVAWNHEPAGNATIRFTDVWKIEGTVRVDEFEELPGPAAQRRAAEWPGTPAATLFATRAGLLDALLPDAWPEFPFTAELERAWDDFRAKLPREWDASTDSYQFALVSVDTRGIVPVLEFGVVLRSSVPFAPLPMPHAGIPYVWGITPGWMDPWRGEPLSLYAASGQRMRAFANQERTMNSVLEDARPGRIVPYDARLDVDFAQIADIAKALARKAAQEQLLPAFDANDVERDVLPWIAAAGELGRLQIEGRFAGAELHFTGALLPPAEDDVEVDGGT